jgi:hypothetical protein
VSVGHWLYVWLGLSNASGSPYLFWSGIFGDASIFAAAVAFLLHSRCHSKGCFRRAKYPDASGTYKVCRVCHPDVPNRGPTREHIAAAHKEAQS